MAFRVVDSLDTRNTARGDFGRPMPRGLRPNSTGNPNSNGIPFSATGPVRTDLRAISMQELVIESWLAPNVGYWKDVWRFRELLYFLAWRDLLVRYKQTVVGVAWALVRPVVTMLDSDRGVRPCGQTAVWGGGLSARGAVRRFAVAVLRDGFVGEREQLGE